MKVAVYLRTATSGQDEEQQLAAQRDLVTQPYAQHGMVIHDFHTDRGVSGLTAFEQRPEGSRLLDDAQTRAFDVVIVQRIDRLARDASIIGTVQHQLAASGIQLESLDCRPTPVVSY